ncbi:LacI family DNA-binding transcriptional regulator [Bacillus sonorensis]|uniref:Transcriptional regulator n=2 Tax=Bacillus sonorensis TaxID=119858 RepID=M5P626_9BACI|nr:MULTISPECIES: LacI family DNA-binding transcriptional regulator [Bacillus]TWK74692.1 HTH-type transcriptional regulator DegA [Bacillus paralicheniformis]ASB87408.1 putative HTH-type transcriptional regulator YvdE [Bacillus sonorensis]EME75441.1 transcriptional regulator [Bacillus sonorensis L12]MBG9913941.1 LacI family transcriptional regulator [Bacillus sonorensis]MCF7616869.1 LacI family transcriptional regulator [Bacillus sonorensis]
MATLSDVAKKANVSKMTVSRVINHPETVTDELKKLVYSAMEELNYIPNYAARALVQNRTQVVKLLILEEMDTTEPYYMNLLTGISRELDRHHYALQLVTRKSLNIGQCDGIIATGVRRTDFEGVVKAFEKPVVVFGQNEMGYDFIDVNNEKGAFMATRHVMGLGSREIAFFGIDLDEPFERSREKGYMKAMNEGFRKTNIFRMENSSKKSEGLAREWLESHDDPSAVVCASDRIALGVIRAVQSLGKRIPDDVAVTGYDGVFLDRISSPRLTTVRQPVVEMGEACARTLLKKIHEDGAVQGNQFFEPELIVRESTL